MGLLLLVGCASSQRVVVDLTHRLAVGIPIYPGGTPLSLEKKADLAKDGYYMNTLRVGEHTGLVTYAREKIVPRRASASMFGVRTTGCPS